MQTRDWIQLKIGRYWVLIASNEMERLDSWFLRRRFRTRPPHVALSVWSKQSKTGAHLSKNLTDLGTRYEIPLLSQYSLSTFPVLPRMPGIITERGMLKRQTGE